jgi:hypothetical protein
MLRPNAERDFGVIHHLPASGSSKGKMFGFGLSAHIKHIHAELNPFQVV